MKMDLGLSFGKFLLDLKGLETVPILINGFDIMGTLRIEHKNEIDELAGPQMQHMPLSQTLPAGRL